MTWNVFVHDYRGSEWLGTVNAHTEPEARAVALIKFHIRVDADFDVSPR